MTVGRLVETVLWLCGPSSGLLVVTAAVIGGGLDRSDRIAAGVLRYECVRPR